MPTARAARAPTRPRNADRNAAAKTPSRHARAAAPVNAVRSSFRATLDLTAKAMGMLRVEGEAVCIAPGFEVTLRPADYLDGSTLVLVLEACGRTPNGRQRTSTGAPPGRRAAVRYEMPDADEIEQVVIRSAAPAFAAPVTPIHH